MKPSETVRNMISSAAAFAEDNHYEYVTPEMLLLFAAHDPLFREAFSESGGNTDRLISDLSGYIGKYDEKTDEEPKVSAGFDFVLGFAERSARNSGNETVELRHVVHGLYQLENTYALYFLKKQRVEEAEFLMNLSVGEQTEDDFEITDDELFGEIDEHDEFEGSGKFDISSYAPCLNDTLKDVNPLIGREEELERTIQILCRRDKNNPLHLGEPGVGKTAITYGLVTRIREGDVPEPLKKARIYALDLGSMIAGTQFRGEFEKRFKRVLKEIAKDESPIIYIDEIHNLSGTGAVGESSFDASNMLKSYLTDGHIRFIGATTFEEYKKYFERSKSLVRRFQTVEIKEPSAEETVKILNGLKSRYEKFHGIEYADGVIEYAVEMSAKFINERFLPDKAIDLIDEAGAYRKLHPSENNIVDKSMIAQVLTKICRVPVETAGLEEKDNLAHLEDNLKGIVFGQDEAVEQVVNAVKFSKAGLLEEDKPLASLLFVGPTGVGKTEVARSLASQLGLHLVRFDMSEYEERHSVAKLIGAPAGYVGYEEGGLLTEEIRKHPSSVLLLDEIEKAHPDIYNILLQITDYATLTDNQGRKADFRNVIIIMTSNAGAERVGKSMIGFGTAGLDKSAITEEVKRIFRPEFRNRLNRIVVFNEMNEDMAHRIAKKKITELAALLKRKNIILTADDAAVGLITKKGISREFGAREADRVIRNEIKPLLVDKILFGELSDGGEVLVTVRDGGFVLDMSGGK